MQPHGRKHATKTTANNHNFNFFFDGLAVDFLFYVGVFYKISEFPRDLLILIVPICSYALVSFLLIFFA